MWKWSSGVKRPVNENWLKMLDMVLSKLTCVDVFMHKSRLWHNIIIERKYDITNEILYRSIVWFWRIFQRRAIKMQLTTQLYTFLLTSVSTDCKMTGIKNDDTENGVTLHCLDHFSNWVRRRDLEQGTCPVHLSLRWVSEKLYNHKVRSIFMYFRPPSYWRLTYLAYSINFHWKAICFYNEFFTQIYTLEIKESFPKIHKSIVSIPVMLEVRKYPMVQWRQ